MANGAIFEASREASGGALARGFSQGFGLTQGAIQAAENKQFRQTQLDRQRRQDEFQNDFKLGSLGLQLGLNKNMPGETRAKGFNLFLQKFGKLNGRSISGSVTAADFGDAKRKKIITDTGDKVSELLAEFEKPGTSGKRRSLLNQQIGGLVREGKTLLDASDTSGAGILESLGKEAKKSAELGEEERQQQLRVQAFTERKFPGQTGIATEEQTREITRFQALDQAEQQKELAVVAPKPRKLTPIQQEQDRILQIPESERTEEEKELLGSRIAEKETTFDKLQGDLKDKTPEEITAFWQLDPSIDETTAENLTNAYLVATGKQKPEETSNFGELISTVAQYMVTNPFSGFAGGLIDALQKKQVKVQTGPVGKGFPDSVTFERVRENSKKANMSEADYLNWLSGQLGIKK